MCCVYENKDVCKLTAKECTYPCNNFTIEDNSSEVTVHDLLSILNALNTIKVVYNDEVLYNDYDSNTVIDMIDGDPVYGERMPVSPALRSRHADFMNKRVFKISIQIVHQHHAIVHIEGE